MTAHRCTEVKSSCQCNRSGRHRIHRCDCGGAWEYVRGQFVVRAWPSLRTLLAMLPELPEFDEDEVLRWTEDRLNMEGNR